MILLYLIKGWRAYQIKLIDALLLSLHTHLHLQVENRKYHQSEIAITRTNQVGSVPGPADYNVKKPLHQTATIAQTTQARNLYKKFESNPGPGAYESKSHISVLPHLGRTESKGRSVYVSSTTTRPLQDLRTTKLKGAKYSIRLQFLP